MITLISALLGLISSAIPTALRMWTTKIEFQHEIDILQLQAQYAAEAGRDQLQEIALSDDQATQQVIYTTYNSGIKWIDTINAFVRPAITFSFFTLYAWVKYHQYTLIGVDQLGTDPMAMLTLMWGQEDMAIFSSIIAFYFGNRAFDKLYSQGSNPLLTASLGAITNNILNADPLAPVATTPGPDELNDPKPSSGGILGALGLSDYQINPIKPLDPL